jgi:putative endonuclease
MPPRASRRSLGDFGEAAAAAHLTRQGYTLLARQWRCAQGEIDLVAQQQAQLVFVEVRTRRAAGYGSPEESITPAKQARLVALAYSYLAAHELDTESDWRIDVIAVEVDRAGRVQRLNHICHAVEAC